MMNSQLRMLLWARVAPAPDAVRRLPAVDGLRDGLLHRLRTVARLSGASRQLFTPRRRSLRLFVPIFLAMRTSLGETTDRTRSFSDGLPISARSRGWIRLAGGRACWSCRSWWGPCCCRYSWHWAGSSKRQRVRRQGSRTNRRSAIDRPSLSALSAVGLLWRVTADRRLVGDYACT